MKDAPGSFRTVNLEALRSKISGSESSRRKTYYEFNPQLTHHIIYTENVPEYLRIAFTRIRLGSHRLKIETGRWARIPIEERLCTCGAVQNESHVLLHCPVSDPFRRHFPDLNFEKLSALMEGNPLKVAKYCHMVVNKFEGVLV